jgi:hypothetical protein
LLSLRVNYCTSTHRCSTSVSKSIPDCLPNPTAYAGCSLIPSERRLSLWIPCDRVLRRTREGIEKFKGWRPLSWQRENLLCFPYYCFARLGLWRSMRVEHHRRVLELRAKRLRRRHRREIQASRRRAVLRNRPPETRGSLPTETRRNRGLRNRGRLRRIRTSRVRPIRIIRTLMMRTRAQVRMARPVSRERLPIRAQRRMADRPTQGPKIRAQIRVLRILAALRLQGDENLEAGW